MDGNGYIPLHRRGSIKVKDGDGDGDGFDVLIGIGGTLLSALLSSVNSISVGASGALMGLLGAQISFIALNWEDLPNSGTVWNTGFFFVLIPMPSPS